MKEVALSEVKDELSRYLRQADLDDAPRQSGRLEANVAAGLGLLLHPLEQEAIGVGEVSVSKKLPAALADVATRSSVCISLGGN